MVDKLTIDSLRRLLPEVNWQRAETQLGWEPGSLDALRAKAEGIVAAYDAPANDSDRGPAMWDEDGVLQHLRQLRDDAILMIDALGKKADTADRQRR